MAKCAAASIIVTRCAEIGGINIIWRGNHMPSPISREMASAMRYQTNQKWRLFGARRQAVKSARQRVSGSESPLI